MKKTLLIAAAALLLGTVGASFAQMATTGHGVGIVGSATSNTDLSADHHVKVHIPTVVLLQIQGSGAADVQFSPTADDIYNALNSTTFSINPNAQSASSNPSTFSDVRGFTNGGANVTVNADVTTDATAPSGGSIPAVDGTILDNLTLGTSTLSGGVTKDIAANSTPAWTTLWSLSDFHLKLSGTETPGTYSYTVTYTATVP